MKTLNLVFIICGLLTSYVSYKVYNSMVLQVSILEEFNTRQFTDETLEKVTSMDYTLPNITVTTLPMTDIVARYYFLSENFDEAFKVLNNNKSANPYLYTSEILKSEMFSYLKVNDSALYYAKKCFVNMPNNPFYFETTAKQLKLAGLQDSILSYYSKIPDKMQLVNFKTILAIFVSDSASVNPKLIDIATEARILYPEDTNIQVLSDYILSGSLNVQKAVQLATDASKLIEQQSYEKAASMYIEAANLNKNDYTYFENAGYTLNLLNKHEEAVSYLQKVVDSLNPGTGKSEYLLGVSLNQLGKTEQACNYLRKAVKMNFKPAYQDFSKYCQ